MNNNQNKVWIKIKSKKKLQNAPSEIQINMEGDVYIDGVLYDEENSIYSNLSVDIEKHNRMNSGEETSKIIASRKTAKKDELINIKDIKGNDRTESTTVKF